MNEKILARGNLGIKRFFNLDTQAYNDGALPKKTKELLGLVASMVLRCDDCVTYHIIQCVEPRDLVCFHFHLSTTSQIARKKIIIKRIVLRTSACQGLVLLRPILTGATAPKR
ncbi:carboxymuconolactone decarboxylase family protein [Candidatus Bathyarchaeota archaeon]|nr:MAG: carboxymuconolactone decarboxylase family protein [Candidatus Bathyarchaeota archaeon]